MYHQEDDTGSDMTSDDDMSRSGRETPPPRSVHSFSSDRDREREREWDHRGRSRDVEPRDRWSSYTRNPRSRMPQRDLSLPVMSRPRFGMERDDERRSMDYESHSQDAESYQNVVGLKEDKKPQNPIQDNLENYRKLLSLGVQLAEDDRHSHMTQGHSSRSKRSAYPSTSRGLKPTPEAKKSTHRRGICEDESSHGVIMEKFIKDVSRSSKSGRAREGNDRPPRFPRVPNDNWKDTSSNKRESVVQERASEGSTPRGTFRFNPELMSRNRGLDRKRRYHFDSDDKGSGQDHKNCVRKKPFECGSEMRQAMSMGNLTCPPVADPQTIEFPADPYVCDECGRTFSVISEFVEHQIMHTRENLYEYGESFIHSVAVNEGQKGQGGGKRFECKECGETFNKSAALAEHRRIHAREHLAECKDPEEEDAVMPSPTFSELQKMYGKDKFYECKVCKETFLYSSALIEHQKIHRREEREERERERARARAQRERERERERELGEPFMTCSSFSEFRKMYGKDKIYECKVCGESFLHLSSLREHQKIHTRGNPFENKRMCEETFIPSQSLKRRQKSYKEKPFEFNNGRDGLMESSDLSEHQKIRSRKNFFEGRRYEKPFPESQKSHTITRPPGNTEDEKAFTISSNPNDKQKFPTMENAYERPAICSLRPVEAPKSQGAVGFSKPKVKAESSTQSSSGISHPPEVHSGGNSNEGKEYKGSIIHSPATPRPLKRHRGNDQIECGDEGESSVYISDLNKRRKIPTRESAHEESKNNYKDSTTPSASHAEPQSLPIEASGKSKEDVKFSVPSSSVREHQKARAKKKYIEPNETKSNETSVIQSLFFRELYAIRQRAKLFECQECGETFVHRSDLIEHQKIHDRERPSGSRHYERSVICSLAPTDPQTSYAQERYAEEQARKFQEFGQHSTSNSPSAQKIYVQEKVHSEEFHAMETSVQGSLGQESHAMETSVQESHTEESHAMETSVQESHTEESHAMETNVQESHTEESHAMETNDQETNSQETNGQEIHGEEPHGDGPHGEEPHGEGLHGQEKPEDATPQASGSNEHQKDDTIYECQECGLGFADLTDLTSHQNVHSRKSLVDSREYERSEDHVHSVSEFEKKYSGEKLYECSKCGESFIHSSFLFEHQRVHEEEQLYSVKGCDDGFIVLLPVRPSRNHAQDTDPAVAGSAIRCRQCGQGFIHSSALNEHMRHHRDDELLEQSELAEEIFIHSLALTEYQGSEAETEEKLFECTICGECFFTAKQLGDHHSRVHKDEPYEYGPAYTHASFLTEPLRKHIPLYECKDCGQPFVDDTVITEHVVFHTDDGEEEIVTATAQEVEANVLIPQEVLRVQGSNAEAAEPEVEAAEPEVEAAEPEVEAAEPNGEAEGAEGEAAEPDGEAEQPNGEAEQPNGDADEPDGAGFEDPEERAEEPEDDVEEPEGDADEPDGAGIDDPEEEGEDQEIEVEEPYYNCHECTGTFASSAAFGEHLKTHASVIIFEPANALGECSGYIERASTSAGGADQADDKYFKCDVCGQLFNDRLSLARHQNSHTG